MRKGAGGAALGVATVGGGAVTSGVGGSPVGATVGSLVAGAAVGATGGGGSKPEAASASRQRRPCKTNPAAPKWMPFGTANN